MVFGAVAALMALLIAYIWSTRGFFSALIHMICTIAAGAVAFALWEKIGYMLLASSSPRGVFSWLDGVAWGLALVVPFVLVLAVLRVGIDAMLGANVRVAPMVNYIGGGLCGLVSGVITAGILVMSVGMLRMDTDLGFLGYAPLRYESKGSVVRQGGGMFLPVDHATAGIYGWWSQRVFASDEPLAKWHPNFEEFGGANRMNFGEGKARNTIRPSEFDLVGRFVVGGGTAKLSDVLVDKWSSGVQPVVDPDGKPYDPASRIEGFVINFKRAASEKSGKVVVGPAQIRLVTQNQDGTAHTTLFPIAVSSQADAASPVFARWRFDSPGTYISSVGGADASVFGFEFVVPKDQQPIALYVRGARVLIDPIKKPDVVFPSAFARDAGITNLPAMFSAGGAAISFDTSKSLVMKHTPQAPLTGINLGNTLNHMLQKGQHSPLTIDDETNIVLDGEATFDSKSVRETNSLEKPLRINLFAADKDTTAVRIDVGMTTGYDKVPNPFSLLGPVATSAERSSPPLLVDTAGQVYTPIGYWYEDDVKTIVRFTPGQSITSVDELVSLSKSRPDQKMTLYIRVSKGVKVQHFAIGSKVIATFDPPIETAAR